MESVLGKAPRNVSVLEVRDVAPKKIMLCVSFQLPVLEVEDGPSKRKTEGDSTEVDVSEKKQRQEN